STTRAWACSEAFRNRSPRSATTRWRSSARRCPTASRSLRGPTTARSWACAIASCASRACSSTPNRFSPSTATRCCAISWRADMTITAQEALTRCIEHREIFHDEMLKIMRQIMSGEMSSTMMAAILMGLRVKKETIGEISAAAQVMREFANKVEVDGGPHFVDVVGTGGDGSHTFNISTASTFVAAAAGATVAKHGNRGVSSKSGAADVLEALGASIMLGPAQVADCVRATGIGFMFAPNHHPAMKNVAPVRRELGV